MVTLYQLLNQEARYTRLSSLEEAQKYLVVKNPFGKQRTTTLLDCSAVKRTKKNGKKERIRVKVRREGVENKHNYLKFYKLNTKKEKKRKS